MIDNTLFFICLCVVFTSVNAYRKIEVSDDLRVILAMENETVNIVCKTEMPMAYCGFVHPSGKRFSFSGHSLDNGQCNYPIKVTSKDVGEWKCHIGERNIGLEISQKIILRVVDKIAAITPKIMAVHGKETTLSCVTTKEKTPIRYCRFEPPQGTPFSIDEAVNRSYPILGKYFYPGNMSLNRGDCAITIRKVKYTDVGEWTCGAGLDDDKEYTDVIELKVEGLYTMSTASTTGIAFGAVAIVLFLIVLGLITWKKRRLLGTSERSTEPVEMQELRGRPGTPGSQRQRTPSPARIATPGRALPSVIVESPSDPGTSPMLM